MTDQQWRWARVVLSVPGVVGFFLPFTADVSPLEIARDHDNSSLLFPWSATVLAASLPFAVFICNLRHTIFGPLSRPEMVACVVLGVVSSALITNWLWLWAYETLQSVSILVPWVLCGAHAVGLILYRRQVFTDSGAALAELMAGFLPTATHYLFLYSWGLQSGAYFILLACVCYIGMILMTVARLSSQAAHPKDE